ncbi:hypothetical protein M413DRAFT_28573 [Hebeloma cylindrosporum]|uniref:Uncharacterized protein n=1 Tax=Hebeloma cylindrosporum TaxID=76867 RepID=A0A0C3BTP1_HEBCY|nr:hypothetical protein M413DRAFT_28573 [Hebeloma cylindrosporum h7]
MPRSLRSQTPKTTQAQPEQTPEPDHTSDEEETSSLKQLTDPQGPPDEEEQDPQDKEERDEMVNAITNSPLPNRSHGSAPKFDGKPWSLHHFLTEVRSLTNDRGLSDKRAIEAALTYAPTSEFELWKSLGAAKGDDWEKFVEALIKLYPGAGGDRKFSKNDLKLLVSRSSQVPMADQVMLGEYYRSFINIVTFLEEKK